MVKPGNTAKTMQILINNAESFSQRGLRDSQQDCLIPTEPTANTSFFVVCDGVGGNDHGEVASSLVCETFERNLRNEDCSKLTAKEVKALIQEAFKTLYSNRAISTSMATTLAFMATTDKGMLLAHMGDTRIYQIRKGNGVIYQTKDHSLVNDLLDSGKITLEEASNHPKSHVITKCLFVTDNKKRYLSPTIALIHDVRPHDIFLLCTDGVYNKVSNNMLTQILTSNYSLKDRANELATLCKDSDDNNSAYVVEITDTINVKPSLISRFCDFVRENLRFVKQNKYLE